MECETTNFLLDRKRLDIDNILYFVKCLLIVFASRKSRKRKNESCFVIRAHCFQSRKNTTKNSFLASHFLPFEMQIMFSLCLYPWLLTTSLKNINSQTHRLHDGRQHSDNILSQLIVKIINEEQEKRELLPYLLYLDAEFKHLMF